MNILWAKRILLNGVIGIGILGLAACGTPSAGIGIRIPGTPVSIGVSAPLDKNGNLVLTGRDPNKTVYRQVTIDSDPAGADITTDGDSIGTTPSTVSVPFDKGWFGSAKGSTVIKLQKPGYATDTFRVFPSGKSASLASDGSGTGTIKRGLRATGLTTSGPTTGAGRGAYSSK